MILDVCEHKNHDVLGEARRESGLRASVKC